MTEDDPSVLRELLRCGSRPKCRVYRVDRDGDGAWLVSLSVLPALTVEDFSQEDADAMCRAVCPSLFDDSPS